MFTENHGEDLRVTLCLCVSVVQFYPTQGLPKIAVEKSKGQLSLTFFSYINNTLNLSDNDNCIHPRDMKPGALPGM